MKRPIIAVVMFSLIYPVGCVTTPSQETLAAVDYGPTPSHDLSRQQIEYAIKQVLKDPDSLQIRNFQYTGTGWAGGGLLTKRYYGHKYSFEANAKNSFGGYVGFRPGVAIVHTNILNLCFYTDGDGYPQLVTATPYTHEPTKDAKVSGGKRPRVQAVDLTNYR